MSSEQDPGALQVRIDRLERRVAIVTGTLAVTAALLVIAVMAALADGHAVVSAQGRSAAPAELVATRFKLVDAAGKPRGAFYVEGQTAGVALSDPAGRTRLLLNTDGESTRLAITGAQQGFPRIVIAQDGDVQMFNMENAKTSHVAILHTEATPTLRLASGEQSVELGIAERLVPRAKPTLAPTLTLKQGDRTLASLPATPLR
jgi:hypothetical protein